MVFVAWVCAVSVDRACHDSEPPVSRPVGGTPRAGYCDALDRVGLEPSLIVAPVLLVALSLVAFRKRPRVALAVVACVVAATIANAVIAHALEHSVTI